MKLIHSRLLQKSEGRKRAKYRIVLDVTDYDIEMLEDLSQVYCTTDEKTELKEGYTKWLKADAAAAVHRRDGRFCAVQSDDRESCL